MTHFPALFDLLEQINRINNKVLQLQSNENQELRGVIQLIKQLNQLIL